MGRERDPDATARHEKRPTLRERSHMTTGLRQPERSGLPNSGVERADRETFVMKVSAALRKLVRLNYFSWEIEGIEHVPSTGPVVFAQNHAGWFALDTIFVGCSVAEEISPSRAPYFAAEGHPSVCLRSSSRSASTRRACRAPASHSGKPTAYTSGTVASWNSQSRAGRHALARLSSFVAMARGGAITESIAA